MLPYSELFFQKKLAWLFVLSLFNFVRICHCCIKFLRIIGLSWRKELEKKIIFYPQFSLFSPSFWSFGKILEFSNFFWVKDIIFFSIFLSEWINNSQNFNEKLTNAKRIWIKTKQKNSKSQVFFLVFKILFSSQLSVQIKQGKVVSTCSQQRSGSSKQSPLQSNPNNKPTSTPNPRPKDN